ncbi:MAG: flagellar basal body P-ring protein FlgI, partial [Luminiphilus sp.]
NLPPGVNPQTKNMASVMVTAELPPFTKPGQKMPGRRFPETLALTSVSPPFLVVATLTSVSTSSEG